MTELFEGNDKQPKWSAGMTYKHKASFNRYQIYNVLSVRYHEEAMFGSGAYIYNIELSEFSDSKMRNCTNSITREWCEVQLPIHNQDSNW